jgi:outer membrane protein OmpA-like peptidoglycan-associated protein
MFFAQHSIAQIDPNKKTVTSGVRVTQAPITVIKLVYVKHNLCNGDRKGAINIDVSGGIPPYTYKWNNGSITQDLTGLPSGNYSVFVYDANKCKDSMVIAVNETPKLNLIEDSISDILCYGYKKGAINISVKGGTMPYKYNWSNGATTEDLSNVAAGTYSVLISDANNCQEILSATVAQNPLIVRSIDDVKNIKCQGDSTGKVDISVSGGIPPYSYAWNNGATTEDLMNVKAGKYTVVVTDANGCMEASNTSVIEPAKLTAVVENVKHIKCSGSNNGSVSISVAGGILPYKYKWSNGAVSEDITGVPAGTYSVSVIDANGCSVNTSAAINEPTLLIVAVAKQNNVSFNGGSNGAISISASGGVSPYSYKWSNGATTKDVSGLKAGNYSLIVTDANECIKNVYVLITEPLLLVLKLESIKNVKCNGDNAGVINVSITGGVPPYTYKWNNGSTSEDLTGIVAGNYSLEVTDANGIKKSISAQITQPEYFDVKLESVENILCYGDYKGAVNIGVTGGVAPYKYKWSNGAITQDIAAIPTGNYSVEVTDANGCHRTVSTTVNQSSQIVASISEIKNVLCFGDKSGVANVSVNGGVAPYAFTWSNGSYLQNLSGVVSGNYTLNIKDSKGCTKSLTASITQPNLLKVSQDLVKNVSCNGKSNGAINITVAGGVAPYKYNWSNGVAIKNLTNVVSGNYSVKVSDANGCTNSLSATITQPPRLVSTLDGVTNVTCYGNSKGAVNISVTGGMPPYAYKWSNGSISQDLIDIKAGSYAVQINDANGCKDTINAKVTQNPLLEAKTESEKNIKCHGESKGAINISVKGGIAPYTYKWSNGAISQNILEAPAGIYSATITDAVGCIKTISAKLTEPPLFVANLENKSDVNCFGDSTGAVSINVKGGVAPYSYKWSNGSSAEDISTLKSGNYSVAVTDANGCYQSISVRISQPGILLTNVESVTNLNCNGDNAGVVNISVKGGTTPYNFKWNNGASTEDLTDVAAGNYSVLISDANGCKRNLKATLTEPKELEVVQESVKNINCFGDRKGAAVISVKGGIAPYTYSWSNGAITKDILDVPAGNYTVIVKDSKGCIKSLGINMSQPPLLSASVSEVKNILCYNDTTGSIGINVKGGTIPYTFKWSNGDATEDLKNVAAGNYNVSITDAKGCIQNVSATISRPPALVPTFEAVRHVLCAGANSGIVNISVTGGVAPYSYKWTNGATTQDLTEVGAGSYSVMITDANACKGKSISANINEPALLNVEVTTVKDVLHYGENNGSANIAVNGGVPPYKYSWSNGTIAQDLIAAPAGNYACIVTDANGCLQTVTALISQPSSLEASVAVVKNIKCYGNSDGAISISVTGGAPPYTYAWSNGAHSEDLTDVAAGSYSVLISDAIGNKKSLKAEVVQPSVFSLKIDKVKNLTCNESKNGSVTTFVLGGTPPYKFTWSNGTTTNDLSNAPEGAYTVTVIDFNGCEKTANVTITQPSDLLVSVSDVKHLNCEGENKGAIDIDVSGGVAPYSYSWSTGAKTQDIFGLNAGSYSVRVMDANGCVKTIAETITEPEELLINVASVKNNNCFGEKSGSITLTATGGIAPYNFKWNNGSTTQNVDSLRSGKYYVLVTDSKGCPGKAEAEIEEPKILVVTLDNFKNVKCNAESTGEINISVSGGVQPYTYNWSNGASTQDVSKLTIGEYAVTVTDANGCTNNSIKASISEPKLLAITLDTVSNIACNGNRLGSIHISVSGGTLPYSYTWSNGSIVEDIARLNSGTYTVNVKDNNGCIETITTTISEPSAIVMNVEEVKNIKCGGDNNGEIKIAVSGGLPPYKFKWSNGDTTQNISGVTGGEYSVVVTDASGCTQNLKASITQPPMIVQSLDAVTNLKCSGDNSGEIHVTVADGVPPYSYLWSNGATSQDLIGVPAGEYSVKITEGNGCERTIAAKVSEPSVFNVQIDEVTNILCYGEKKGAIDLSVKGGVAPYKIQWSNGVGTEDLKEVKAESYSVMVMDANGCLKSASAVITEPAPLQLIIDSLWSVKCCGDSSGAIFISVTGGVGPYKYLWSNGVTTEDIRGLKMGQYTVTVTDQNGCIISTPKEGMTLYDQIISQGKFITRNILFDIGKSTIKTESFSEILKIATLMKDHPDLMFSIEGHTDSDGDELSNKTLSNDRSNAIMDALIKLGIDAYRLEAKGWGEARAIDTNLTKEGKSNNRRVEFILLLPPSSSK